MVIQKTLVLIKPDGVAAGCTENMLKLFQSNGFSLVGTVKYFNLTEAQASAFYGAEYVTSAVLALTERLLAAFILEGEDAIARAQEINKSMTPEAIWMNPSASDLSDAVHVSKTAVAFERESRIIWDWSIHT